MYILIEVFRVMEPSRLVDMMAERAGNHVIFIGIRAVYQKLGHHIPDWCLLDMFSQ